MGTEEVQGIPIIRSRCQDKEYMKTQKTEDLECVAVIYISCRIMKVLQLFAVMIIRH
jgi:hypothetical protein